jgi:hypothetical protein
MDVGLNGISAVLPQEQKISIEKMYHICVWSANKKTRARQATGPTLARSVKLLYKKNKISQQGGENHDISNLPLRQDRSQPHVYAQKQRKNGRDRSHHHRS